MSNTIKQLKDVQGNVFDPQTSIEALTSTEGGKLLSTNELGHVVLTTIGDLTGGLLYGGIVYPSTAITPDTFLPVSAQ